MLSLVQQYGQLTAARSVLDILCVEDLLARLVVLFAFEGLVTFWTQMNDHWFSRRRVVTPFLLFVCS